MTRIIELLQPFLTPACEQQLTARDYECISIYIDILQRWNARINLTAVRNEEEIVTRHFGESFFAASNLFPGRGGEEGELKEPGTRKVVARSTVADIGSGAGFPGIPIKLWAPSVALTLIESNHKKAAFLREVTRFLRLTGINVQSARAEHIDQTFDFVILRAVERFTDILPIAAGLLAPSGRLALLISSSQFEQASSVLPQLIWQPPLPIPMSDSRILVVGDGNIDSQQVGERDR
ncbi:MAG: 16S rRNA (guanine(527)-N(7))-methyltransferase RsmG [Candidatus Sulfotelmatobacter sp.]